MISIPLVSHGSEPLQHFWLSRTKSSVKPYLYCLVPSTPRHNQQRSPPTSSASSDASSTPLLPAPLQNDRTYPTLIFTTPIRHHNHPKDAPDNFPQLCHLCLPSLPNGRSLLSRNLQRLCRSRSTFRPPTNRSMVCRHGSHEPDLHALHDAFRPCRCKWLHYLSCALERV